MSLYSNRFTFAKQQRQTIENVFQFVFIRKSIQEQCKTEYIIRPIIIKLRKMEL